MADRQQGQAPPQGERVWSREDLPHYPTKNVGQPVITTTVAVCECFVVQAQGMQYGGVQVVDMHLVPDSMPAEVIRCAVHMASSDPASR